MFLLSLQIDSYSNIALGNGCFRANFYSAQSNGDTRSQLHVRQYEKYIKYFDRSL